MPSKLNPRKGVDEITPLVHFRPFAASQGKSMSTRIQVAFQGGGAKLVLLLAVAEVIQAAHRLGEIQVTRVAGTSAGSIVATLIAADIDIASVRGSIIRKDGSLTEVGAELANYYGRKPTTYELYQCYKGTPLRSMTHLANWLRNQFPDVNRSYSINDVESIDNIQLLIPATNLGSRALVTAHTNTNVIEQILNSCGLPFFFRVWSKDGSPTSLVDGGIAENLPVDLLVDKQEELGPVLAIAFSPPNTVAPSSLKEFVLAILDTAISRAESKARQGLPQSQVFEISSRFATFEFKRALETGLGDYYELMKRDAADWLSTFLRSRKKDLKQLAVNPWSETNATAEFLLNQLGLAYQRIEMIRPIKYHSVVFSVFANSLKSQDDIRVTQIDTAELILRFSTCNNEVSSLAIGIIDAQVSDLLDPNMRRHKINISGRPIDTIAIPMRTKDHFSSRDLCVFFDPPLPPNTGPYELEYVEYGSNFFEPLAKTGVDEIEYTPRRPGGNIDEVRLIAYVPEEFDITMTPRGSRGSARQLERHECLDEARLPGMKGVGWVARDVPILPPGAGESWAVDLLHVLS
ncbi:patatin-like phospholipase family protein [Variovorax sp. dw_954]|uniref:patatin-like phospholipase family protein n=1 Tax=Variovorax sp. dw_954 TaxID=2720078 RepID=UPI001BD499DA|nr:patatin-like phospholipase family protein [Variovorax sp. dw_954]